MPAPSVHASIDQTPRSVFALGAASRHGKDNSPKPIPPGVWIERWSFPEDDEVWEVDALESLLLRNKQK